MKATELRIGNYLNFLNAETGKFDEIQNDGLQVEPIPLNKEWLLKLGFKKWEYEDYEKGNIRLMSSPIDYYTNEYWLDGYGDSKIKYVHQLQNLYFALTQTELEVKEMA